MPAPDEVRRRNIEQDREVQERIIHGARNKVSHGFSQRYKVVARGKRPEPQPADVGRGSHIVRRLYGDYGDSGTLKSDTDPFGNAVLVARG